MNLKEFRNNLVLLVRDHKLPRITILDIIEQTLGEVLSTRYPDEKITVRLDEDSMEFRIIASSMREGGVWREIPIERLSGIKNLHKHIRNALQRAQVIQRVRQVRQHLNEIVQGKVICIKETGDLIVEIRLEGDMVIATCPKGMLPKDERGIGFGEREIWFHLRNCQPIMLGEIPRVEITLDRTSKNLPQKLLRHLLPATQKDGRITCRVRKPGFYSEIWVDQFIPKTVVNELKKELKEKVFIVIGKNGSEIRKNRRKLAKNRKKPIEITDGF